MPKPRITAEILLENKKFSQKLDETNRRLKRFAGTIKGTFATIGAALVLRELTALARESIELTRVLERMSRTTGISAEAIQVLNHAAEQTGSTAADMERSIVAFTRRLGAFADDGAGPAANALRKLGFSQREVQETDPTEMFVRVVDALSKIEEQSILVQRADALFSESIRRQIPLLQGGAAGLQRYTAEARKLGIVLTSDAVKQGDRLNRQFELSSRILKTELTRAFLELSPAITKSLRAFTDFIRTTRQALSSLATLGSGGLSFFNFPIQAAKRYTSLGNSIISLSSIAFNELHRLVNQPIAARSSGVTIWTVPQIMTDLWKGMPKLVKDAFASIKNTINENLALFSQIKDIFEIISAPFGTRISKATEIIKRRQQGETAGGEVLPGVSEQDQAERIQRPGEIAEAQREKFELFRQDVKTVLNDVGRDVQALTDDLGPLLDISGLVRDALVALGSADPQVAATFAPTFEKLEAEIKRLDANLEEVLGEGFGKYGPIISKDLNTILDLFRDFQREAVGQSIIPDTITAIGEWFAKLPSLMGGPTRTAVQEVTNEMESVRKAIDPTLKKATVDIEAFRGALLDVNKASQGRGIIARVTELKTEMRELAETAQFIREHPSQFSPAVREQFSGILDTGDVGVERAKASIETRRAVENIRSLAQIFNNTTEQMVIGLARGTRDLNDIWNDWLTNTLANLLSRGFQNITQKIIDSVAGSLAESAAARFLGSLFGSAASGGLNKAGGLHRFQQGGFRGFGGFGFGDTRPGLFTPGEFTVNRRGVAFLDDLNQGRIPRLFKQSQAQQAQPVEVVVNLMNPIDPRTTEIPEDRIVQIIVNKVRYDGVVRRVIQNSIGR